MPGPFKKGDVVRYTGAFLRSTGQYTPPLNGLVTGLSKMGSEQWPLVQWSDAEEPVMVHPANLEHDPRTPNAGVSRGEKARRRARGEKSRKAKKKRRKKKKSKRLPNAPVVPGDLVQIKGPGHRRGTVEAVTERTVWVRLDPSGKLLGADLDELKMAEGGAVRNALVEVLENPAEEIAAAAYAYVGALNEQVRAMRTGSTDEARRARREVQKSLRELESAAAGRTTVSSAVGAALGGGIGALAGPPGAAVGALAGSLLGSVVGRPFARRKEEKPGRETPTRTLPTAEQVRPAGPREVPPPAPVTLEPEQFEEGFEEFFEEDAAANAAANPRRRNLNRLKRRLMK